MAEMMTTREVADYLRIKERKVYDLVAGGRIPCTRVTGKLLFPKALIDRWMAGGTDSPAALRAAPPVVAGSRDPLHDWAVRESGSGLALIAGGSLDGVRRLAAGEALVAGLHLLDPASGGYNLPVLQAELGRLPVVAVEWAMREQGLVLPAGNPRGLGGPPDLAGRGLPVVRRQPGSGARVLFDHLLAAAGVNEDAVAWLPDLAGTGQEVGLAVLEGRAAAGLATRAVARQLKLDFLPLANERFDLALRRRDYFEPPFQTLLAFAGTDAFRRRAQALGGYDVANLGAVRWNAP